MTLPIGHTSSQMLKQPRVSILINNYNYEHFLEACMLSALAQDYSNFEVIVVDDGSTDGSKEVIQQYSDRVMAVFQKNSGQASAFNKGFEISKGEVVCFLDADDTFYSNKLSEIVALFVDNPDIKWIFHELDYIDRESEKLDVKRDRALTHPVFIDARDAMRMGNPPKESIPCGLCFRREILDRILPMPESSGVSVSDGYLKYAAIGLGPGLLLNRSLAFQRVHGNNTYTFREGNSRLRAEIHLKTGCYLQERFPEVGLFADKLFIRGVAEMLVTCDFGRIFHSQELKQHLSRNFRLQFIVLNSLKCLYHCLRLISLKIMSAFTPLLNGLKA
ncbi:MAG: glycosyltransferase [Cyanobacteria bacterium J06581_3]